MKTTDIFKTPKTSQKLNEALEKNFGQRINLQSFSVEQLEDSRNKLRTQIYQYRNSSGFNETVSNDSFTKAQWMLDAINAEIAEREEHIVDNTDEDLNNLEILPDEQGYGESTQGDNMKQVTEGEIQQASAIVTAKTMVDRVGRWIEELSGMENDTLLQLGDSIRDEMGAEQAKNFISAVAPAIQQALENLKTTRETLATGVRTLTGEEQGAEMIGADGEEGPAEEEPEMAAPDEMNAEPDLGAEDEFAAAEPAAGGAEEAGRAKRESIEYQNRLLKVLAG